MPHASSNDLYQMLLEAVCDAITLASEDAIEGKKMEDAAEGDDRFEGRVEARGQSTRVRSDMICCDEFLRPV